MIDSIQTSPHLLTSSFLSIVSLPLQSSPQTTLMPPSKLRDSVYTQVLGDVEIWLSQMTDTSTSDLRHPPMRRQGRLPGNALENI
jgi:hypothetical protein